MQFSESSSAVHQSSAPDCSYTPCQDICIIAQGNGYNNIMSVSLLQHVCLVSCDTLPPSLMLGGTCPVCLGSLSVSSNVYFIRG